MSVNIKWAVFVGMFLLSACASAPFDYTAFRAHRPRSILVLPPINESIEVHAPYSYLSTVTMPLAERGYYVFPVAMIDEMMKANGLPGPAEMHQASLSKIKSIINPDAVLYITIKEYGTKFEVVDSKTVVRVQARLVDVDSGLELWRSENAAVKGTNSGNSNFLSMLVTAVVAQAVNTGADAAKGVSADVNWGLYFSENQGLLVGPYDQKWDGPTSKALPVASSQ